MADGLSMPGIHLKPACRPCSKNCPTKPVSRRTGSRKEVSGSGKRFHRSAFAAITRTLCFTALDELLKCYEGGEQFEAFENSCKLRKELEGLAGSGVFTSQRYLLHQLDCVMEELGFFALRHVASDYLEHGVALEECLHIVALCAGNLDRDGLFSRELWDLSAMLVHPSRSASELLDVLEQIQRNYHRLGASGQ